MIKSYQEKNGDIVVESKTKFATTKTVWDAAGRMISETCEPACLSCAEKRRLKQKGNNHG